ncbi:TRAP-type C4-dicarboxylate transport system permease small subunit [Sulfitobacter undariae]|uniref:TRAP transporter small permease protein n=1 Tax=Sulfitobacter undariae TaxID=1563671 RepID=A0A7W6E5L8_9RHOB|nr:TRAP transporter small permease [Sulfitobacter undariae]MBB3995170.1 TRAP-type C4-dicarboxylate transport system permease small subunit [Sulfitobacter undariae]
MKAIGKAISWLISGLTSVAGILVVLLVCHVTIDVTMRFVFGHPLNATILYVSAFYMVGIAFLPLAAVEEKDGHIAVELLVERFPNKVQSLIAIFGTIITIVVAAAVAMRTGQEALAKYATGSYSIEAGGKVLTWPTYFVLPLGFGLMALVALWKLYGMVTGRETGLSSLAIEDPYLGDKEVI